MFYVSIVERLRNYDTITEISQVVRNDMTNEKQSKLTNKIIMKLWRKKKRMEFDCRGRKLKIRDFPELSDVLEHIFQVSFGVELLDFKDILAFISY